MNLAAIQKLLDDPATREDGLRELGESRIRTAPSISAAHLEDRDSSVRVAALECLLARGNRRHADSVILRLSDQDEIARASAIECLVEWGCRAAAPKISATLNDRSPLVRAYAAWALGRLRADAHIGHLRARLQRERQDIARAGLLEALYRLTQSDDLLDRLISILRSSEDHQARAFASNSLAGVVNARNRNRVIPALEQAATSDPATGIRDTIKANLIEARG